MISIQEIISGICWTITYIALIYRGFKDKSYGMPLAALALNFSWEFTYTFIYPPESGLGVLIVNAIWCLFDVGLIITFLKNGHKYYKEAYGLSRPVFYTTTAIAFSLSFAIMILGGTFFAPFSYFKGETFESAMFIALIQNAVMSILFVQMFYTRKQHGHPIEGQSIYAAVTKLIGTSLTVGILYIEAHPGNWYFASIFTLACLIFDCWYCIVLWREIRAEGMNPLKRF